MNFSDTFPQSAGLAQFSPNGELLASAVQYRLIVRDVNTLQVTQMYNCLDTIQLMEWAPDSQFILCALFKRGIIQVWSVEQSEWTCKIDEGSAGLTDVRWCPDSRHILSTADFHLRITVWSLVSKSVSYIKHPKPCGRGLDFSSDGRYLVLAERRDCKDALSVFDCGAWALVHSFDPDTEDLAGVLWAPNGRCIAVWDSCLHYMVLLYSPDGRCLGRYSAYEGALGVKGLAWSPSAQFIAVGSYDESVRLLNHVTWSLVTELPHPPTIDDPHVLIFQETIRSHSGSVTQAAAPSRYEIVPSGIQIPVVKPDVNKANPRIGIASLSFSADGRYLMTRNDSMPGVLWIWDIPRLRLVALLLHDAPIRAAVWDPCQARLALCTGSNKVYMWSARGALSVQVPCSDAPAPFSVQALRWHPHSNALLLVGKDQMAVCFLSDPPGQAEGPS